MPVGTSDSDSLSHNSDETKPATWKKKFLSLRRTKSFSRHNSETQHRSPIRDLFPALPFRSHSSTAVTAETTPDPESPLVSLSSRQLTELAVAMLHHLESQESERAPNDNSTSDPLSASTLQATRALASPHLQALDQHTMDAIAKLAQLPPDHLRQLATDVERECERRFPDLAVSAVSIVGHKDVETVQRGNRVFLSLSRQKREEMSEESSQMNPRHLGHGRSQSEGKVVHNTVNETKAVDKRYGGMVGVGTESYETSAPAEVLSPPLRTVTRGFSMMNLRNENARNVRQGITNEHYSRVPSVSALSVRSISPAYAGDAQKDELLHDVESKFKPEWSARTLVAYKYDSGSVIDEYTLDDGDRLSGGIREDLNQTASPRDVDIPEASVETEAADASTPFTEALSILTTPQLLAAVRDVRGVMALRYSPDGTSFPPNPVNTDVDAEPKTATPDETKPLTHCEQLLLQLPMERVRMIWAAVADEVQRRGIDVDVHMDLDRLGVV